MKLNTLAGSVLAAVAFAAPLHAQLVHADVVVRTGPVRGHVVINDRGYSTYRRSAPVVYERPARVIVVERFHSRKDFLRWKRRGVHEVRLYVLNGRYYDREIRNVHGVREVVVYERDGRYYRDNCDDDHDRDHYRDRHHDRDRDHWRD